MENNADKIEDGCQEEKPVPRIERVGHPSGMASVFYWKKDRCSPPFPFTSPEQLQKLVGDGNWTIYDETAD